MDLTTIVELEQHAKILKNDFVGKIELYFMRYGVKTIENTESGESTKIPNAVIYQAEIQAEVQEQLLDIFLLNIEKYKDMGNDIEPYDVIGKEKEVLANLSVDNFRNVKELIEKIKNKTDFIHSLEKLNLNSVNCFCVQIKLTDDKTLYYFGNLDKFTKLKTGFFANIDGAEVKKLRVDKLFGFVNHVNFFEYNNELLITSQDRFNTIFKMKEYFEEVAIPVLDNIQSIGKVSSEDINELKKLCGRDSRIAKRFMKLGIDEEGLSQFFNNLDYNSFEREVFQDPVFRQEFNELTFVDGKLANLNSKSEDYYRQLAKFIRDTAKRGVISKLPKVID